MSIFLRHAQNSLSWETAVLRDTRAQLANVYIQVLQIILKLQQNVEQMGRKGVHGSQFSWLNQSSAKKKKEITNEKKATNSVRVELKKPSIENKINKLERDSIRLQCESSGLKRTIHTLRRSIGKCLLK